MGLPEDVRQLIDRADWRFKATFCILWKKALEKPDISTYELYILAAKLRRIWIDELLPDQYALNTSARDLGLRIPLVGIWDYWVSVREVLDFPQKIIDMTSRAIWSKKNEGFEDIPSTCAVILYKIAKESRKISQKAIAAQFKIPLSRFRKYLSSIEV